MKKESDHKRKIDNLENIVYDRENKLDVFEQINNRITQVESDRKVVEMRLEANDEKIMKTFDDFEFKMSNHDKELKFIVSNTDKVLEELSGIQDVMREQNSSFATSLKEINENLIRE